MNNKKFTDKEIIKALEDYIKENKFEYFHSNMMGEYPLIRKSLDFINCQKAFIESQNELISKLALAGKNAKAEAYKEFANQIKIHKRRMRGFDLCYEFWDYAVSVEDIDNILKTMVGEEE